MNTLSSGTYKISNAAEGPGETTLYLTFPGEGMPLTLYPDAIWASQIWTVTGDPGLQSIIPKSTGFETNASLAGEYVQATCSPCQWYIVPSLVQDFYTIQTIDIETMLNWDLAGTPDAGQLVVLASPSGNLPQYWKFTHMQDPDPTPSEPPC